jgi:hypothetical protein
MAAGGGEERSVPMRGGELIAESLITELAAPDRPAAWTAGRSRPTRRGRR